MGWTGYPVNGLSSNGLANFHRISWHKIAPDIRQPELSIALANIDVPSTNPSKNLRYLYWQALRNFPITKCTKIFAAVCKCPYCCCIQITNIIFFLNISVIVCPILLTWALEKEGQGCKELIVKGKARLRKKITACANCAPNTPGAFLTHLYIPRKSLTLSAYIRPLRGR